MVNFEVTTLHVLACCDGLNLNYKMKCNVIKNMGQGDTMQYRSLCASHPPARGLTPVCSKVSEVERHISGPHCSCTIYFCQSTVLLQLRNIAIRTSSNTLSFLLVHIHCECSPQTFFSWLICTEKDRKKSPLL